MLHKMTLILFSNNLNIPIINENNGPWHITKKRRDNNHMMMIDTMEDSIN